MANGLFKIQRALKRSSLLLLWCGLLATPGRISQQKIHGDEKEACAVPGSATHLCLRSPETLPADSGSVSCERQSISRPRTWWFSGKQGCCLITGLPLLLALEAVSGLHRLALGASCLTALGR